MLFKDLTIHAMCEHIPGSSFAAVLPEKYFDGAPLLRFENMPSAGVLAMSHQKMLIWCVRCFAIKEKKI